MKYVILNDIQALFIEKKKYIVVYFLILLSAIGLVYLSKYEINNILLAKIVGLMGDSKEGPLSILMFLWHLVFAIYIAIYLFTKDTLGTEMLFLRIKVPRWFLYKMISSTINLFFIRIVVHSLCSILVMNGHFSISIFFIDFGYFWLIQSVAIGIYLVSKRCKIVANILIGIVIVSLFLLKISVILLSEYVFLIFILSISIIPILYVFVKRIHTHIFEN